SASEAYRRLESNDFRSYSFGLQFQMPLSNALARSELTQSRITRSQAELNHRQLLSNVTLEVRKSAADVTSARQRIDTTRVARAHQQPLREARHARVVRLSVRRPPDRFDDEHALGRLEPSQARTHVAAELILAGGGTPVELDEPDDRLPPFLVADTDHDRVVDGGMGLQHLLHLLRVDLLAGGVDADAAAAEERQRPVVLHRAPVSRDHVAYAVDDPERARGLLGVLVVPDGDRATMRDDPRFAAARLDLAAVLGEDLH